MPSYGMWQGINQGLQNFTKMYMMKQQVDLNKQDRGIKMFQIYTNSEQGYAKLEASGANPTTLRNYRQMQADFLTKIGIPVPKNFLNITDSKRLTEASSQAFIGKTGDAIAAWREDINNSQKEAEARKFVGMMQSQTKYKLDVKPWELKLNSIQKRKETLAKQQAEKDQLIEQRKYTEQQKGKEVSDKLKNFEMYQYGEVSLDKRGTPEYRKAFGEYLKLGKGKEGKTGKTTLIKQFEYFKKNNPNYKGTMLDFNKAMKEKDPDQVALELAAKDWGVLAGKKSLADAAIGYRKAWDVLKGDSTTVLPLSLTEKDIVYNMDRYNKTRKEVIEQYKKMRDIR